MHVLFLIGSDLYSYNFANELCIHFAKYKFKASFLVFKNETAFNPAKIQKEIKELIFYERTLFSQVLLPYLKNQVNKGNYVDLDALAKKYEVNYEYCHLINSYDASQFILEKAKEWHIDLAVSIRCIVKFDDHLINYFVNSNDHYFWNLHPGILPQYRGILPVFNSMLNHEINYGLTLLRVSKKLDSGAIIDSISSAIDYSKSMLLNTLDLIPSGVDLIIKTLLKVSKNEKLPVLIQNEAQKGFYSFPTKDEIERFKSHGLSLYSKEEIIKVMQDQYLTGDQKGIFNLLQNYKE